MAFGDLRKKLLDKVKQAEDAVALESVVEETPVQIKNSDPASFSKIPSWYHAKDKTPQVPRSTAKLPTGSILNKPVHERMKAFVKNNTGK